jgi:hypothetical protein
MILVYVVFLIKMNVSAQYVDSHGRSSWVTAKILLMKMIGNKLHLDNFTEGIEPRDHTYRGLRITNTVGEKLVYLSLGEHDT